MSNNRILTPHLFQDIHNGRLFLILRHLHEQSALLSLLRDRNGDHGCALIMYRALSDFGAGQQPACDSKSRATRVAGSQRRPVSRANMSRHSLFRKRKKPPSINMPVTIANCVMFPRNRTNGGASSPR
jgi:hypothetical protein